MSHLCFNVGRKSTETCESGTSAHTVHTRSHTLLLEARSETFAPAEHFHVIKHDVKETSLTEEVA